MNCQDILTRWRQILRWVPCVSPESVPKGGPESITNSIGVILRGILSGVILGLFGGVSVFGFSVSNSANFNEATLKRSNLVRTEVIGGFTTGAKINGLIAAASTVRSSKTGALLIGIQLKIRRRKVTIREEEIHVLGTTRAIGFSPNFANFRIAIIRITTAGAKALVPLVSLLKSNKRLSPAVAPDVQII